MRLDLAVLGCAGVVAATSLGHHQPRALPNAPDGYAPAEVPCPDNRPTIRSAARLSPNEAQWLSRRKEKTAEAMKDFFGRVQIPDYDAVSYIDQVRTRDDGADLPNIAIAASGGGYRALMNGAGAVKAFDSRTEGSTASGQLGGLLQSATYIAGLSGGSWLLSSIYINNFTTVQDLQNGGEGEPWRFDRTLFEGPEEGILDTAGYYKTIYDQVKAKKEAGFNITITDIWARALAHQFINATDGGPDYTWSSIALTSSFKDADLPLPLVVADGRNPGELIVGSNSTVFEFSPWEFGSWDPTVFGFAPLEFLGSPFDGGEIPDDERCVRGFDNAAYVLGTSSSLFNQFLLQSDRLDLPGIIQKLVEEILEDVSDSELDIALYVNPFYNYKQNTKGVFTDHRELNMVDGGEDLQNIPLHPLIQPERHVDVIFAIDSSADTEYSWPNGTAMVATYERSLNSTGIANGTAFPAVPDQNTFVNLGLNTRPTFFGCDSTNTSSVTPLIVYLPNYPYTYFSNASTWDPHYEISERDAIIENGYNVVTQGNATRDANWPTCVACAMLSRSWERTGTQVPDACRRCFQEYCWDGTIASQEPSEYAPATLLEGKAQSEEDGVASILPDVVLLVVSALLSAAFLI